MSRKGSHTSLDRSVTGVVAQRGQDDAVSHRPKSSCEQLRQLVVACAHDELIHDRVGHNRG